MSTRSTIWFGEADGRSVHIYWEYAERVVEGGRMVAAPIFVAAERYGSNNTVAVRLPKDVAETLLSVLCPEALRSDGAKVI